MHIFLFLAVPEVLMCFVVLCLLKRMRKCSLVALLLALLPTSLLAQTVPAPQIGLSGNVGIIGSPILNSGTYQMPSDADVTFTNSNVNTSAFSIKITSAFGLTATRTIHYPAGRFTLNVCNATSGSQSIVIVGPSGSGVTIANGVCETVWNDGTNYVQVGSSGSVTASAMQSALTAQTGCTTAGNAWNPATNTCVATSPTGGGNPETCTVNTATTKCLGISPYVAISGDYTVAITQAITDLCASGAPGGDIYAPDGTYPSSGPLQDTGGANAVIPAPQIANGTTQMCKVSLQGFKDANNGSYNGAIFTTTNNSGNWIGGYDSAAGGGYPPFTNFELTLRNLTLVAPTDPGIVMVNATYLQAVTFENVLCRTVAPAVPSNTSGGCLYMPSILNAYQNHVKNSTFAGFYTNAIFTEHTSFDGVYSESSARGIVFDNGFNATAPGTYHGNSIRGGYLWAFVSTCGISGGANDTVVHIDNFDSELNTHDVCDNAGSKIRLSGGFLNPYNSATAFLNVTGGGLHINMCPLWAPENCGSGVPQLPLSANLIEEWAAHEGSGTTLSNVGSDSTNVATMSNVAWATHPGYSGNQPLYNGLTSGTSVSTASSATLTSFNGTTPFSVCAWHTPTTLTGVAQVFLVNNVSSPLGWGIGEFGDAVADVDGSIFFDLFSSGSNYISVRTEPEVTTGIPNLICATYDGGGHASGVTLYVNGIAEMPTIQQDNFSTSAATSLPVSIGSNQPSNTNPSNGVIGKVEIWTRVLSPTNINTLYVSGPGSIE